jgi:sugar/nucleoside kinase (ribokinase family)
MSLTDRAATLAITVIGNAGLDTLVFVGESEPDLHADGHFVRNVDTVGHAAAFSARGLARLGHRVRILGSVGEDPIGRMVSDVLADDGVDTSLLFPDPVGTARSVNFVFPDGRRTFFYDGGSHMTLIPPEDLVTEALAGADLVVSSLPNWARDVLPRARAAGIPVAVDLQDVRSADDAYRADFVAKADHLFASAAHLPDPAEAARRWFAAGPAAQVVFGLGARGALLARRGDGAAPTVAPPPPGDLPILDTTGCGDSLALGFLDGLLALSLDPHDALHRGQALARIVASATGNDARYDRASLDAAADRRSR